MNPVVTTNSNILCFNLHSEVLVSTGGYFNIKGKHRILS